MTDQERQVLVPQTIANSHLAIANLNVVIAQVMANQLVEAQTQLEFALNTVIAMRNALMLANDSALVIAPAGSERAYAEEIKSYADEMTKKSGGYA